jgi:PqqD family protein of HPr-rel-A system
VRFQLKQYDSEAVIFDTASGDTHYLAPLAQTLLHIIQSNPGMTADEIYAAVADRLSLKASSQLAQLTDEALANLRRIGLLEKP